MHDVARLGSSEVLEIVRRNQFRSCRRTVAVSLIGFGYLVCLGGYYTVNDRRLTDSIEI
jgi:hypothetical protein